MPTIAAQPVWVTAAGSLGIVAENQYNSWILQTTQANSSPVFYQVIAGNLPTGVYCTIAGHLEGIPTTATTTGQDVLISGADVTFKFAIRAYTTVNNTPSGRVERFADRTFTITVAGQSAPVWITPAGEIGQYFDGSLLSPGYQLQYIDENRLPGITPVTLLSGSLPPGLTLSGTGLISGFIEPNPTTSTIAGFSVDGQGFSQYPFDFNTNATDVNYTFTLKLTDGRTSSIRTFSIFVWSTSTFNASTTAITADDTLLDASISSADTPILTNPQGSIGSVRNNTFFAYQFVGYDVNNNSIGYVGYDLPPGLTLNSTTGWLYGYLPNLGLTELVYDFTIRVYLTGSPGVLSDPYAFSLTVIGPINTNITWLVPPDLGTIINGATSLFYVRASNTANLNLTYSLVSGSNSKLPQGLTLLPSGDIVGRVAFDNFMLDNNTTTFDNSTTTFDSKYTFTVNAASANGYISVDQTFTITVINKYGIPYNNLYIECMPPQADRGIINNLIQNTNIFPYSALFRPDDPNFGLATNVTYYHCYGLTAATLDTYVTALQLNHYWKNLTLGAIKTAQAVDPATGNVIYEVVYSEIIDTLVNNSGKSAGPDQVLPYPINPNMSGQIDVVYPNALVDMRNQVIDVVGQESNMLPLWMLSTQADGTVLGFTPAWVIAYVKPGMSGQIQYNIETQYGTQLNQVPFEADRYELDRALTANYNPATDTWIPNPPLLTTFDRQYHYNYAVAIPGSGYAIGDQIKIFGSQLGGVNVANDLLLTVNALPVAVTTVSNIVGNGSTITISINELTAPYATQDVVVLSGVTPSIYNGTYTVANSTTTTITLFGTPTGAYQSGGVLNSTSISGVVCQGTSSLLAADTSYVNVIGTNITGTGTGAEFTITVVSGHETVFDYGSLQFVDPSTVDTNSQASDRYILYPKYNIIDSLPHS